MKTSKGLPPLSFKEACHHEGKAGERSRKDQIVSGASKSLLSLSSSMGIPVPGCPGTASPLGWQGLCE